MSNQSAMALGVGLSLRLPVHRQKILLMLAMHFLSKMATCFIVTYIKHTCYKSDTFAALTFLRKNEKGKVRYVHCLRVNVKDKEAS